MYYLGFNIAPFCSDVCGDHRRPQTLAEICRNMDSCCGFRAVAAREKYPGLTLFKLHTKQHMVETKGFTIPYQVSCVERRSISWIGVSSLNLDECRLIVSWTYVDKYLWNFSRNQNIHVKDNTFGSVYYNCRHFVQAGLQYWPKKIYLLYTYCLFG